MPEGMRVVVLSLILIMPLAVPCVSYCWASDTTIAARQTKGGAGGSCSALFGNDWSADERHLWLSLCDARLRSPGKNETHNIRSASDCELRAARRKRLASIDPAFLRTLLTDPEFNTRLPVGPLHINGVRFERGIDLGGINFDRGLDFSNDVIVGTVNLEDVHAGDSLSFFHSCIFGQVLLRYAHVSGSIYFGNGSPDEPMPFSAKDKLPIEGIDATDTKTDHDFIITNARVARNLVVNGLNVASSLIFSQSSVPSVSASGLHVTDQIALFDDEIGNPNITHRSEEPAANLFSTVADTIIIARVTVYGDIMASSMRLTGGLSLIDARTQLLNVSDSSLGDEFYMGVSREPASSSLKLQPTKIISRDASVKTLDVPFIYWSSDGSIFGLNYSVLGEDMFLGTDGKPLSRGDLRSEALHWLPKGRSFSPEPYAKLADVFEKEGYIDISKDIEYAEKRGEMLESFAQGMYGRGVALLGYEVFVGYGIQPLRAGVWALVLIFLGAQVIRRTPEGQDAGLRYGYVYSFDILLPLVKLREKNYDIDIVGKAKYHISTFISLWVTFWAHISWLLSAFHIEGHSPKLSYAGK